MPNPWNPDEMLQTRQSLISRLKNRDDNESWQDFFNTYWKLIYSFALRSGLRDAEAQEVVQETVISVSKNMPDFKYDRSKGSFKSWLLRLTSWRIADQHRKRKRDAAIMEPLDRIEEGTPWIARVPDPTNPVERVWDEEWERNLTEAALQLLKTQVRAKQYQIFDFYVLKRWPVRKVTATLGVSVGQVYLVRHRLTALLKKQIRALENKF
jgi:RNA polymerase sigma-70 factor (ECF subfamily)